MSLKKTYRDGRRSARVNVKSGWKCESNNDMLDQALADMQMEKEETENYASAVIDALGDVGENDYRDDDLLSTCCGSTPLAGTHLDDSDYVDYGGAASGMCGDCRDHAEVTPNGYEYDDDYYADEEWGCGDPQC